MITSICLLQALFHQEKKKNQNHPDESVKRSDTLTISYKYFGYKLKEQIPLAWLTNTVLLLSLGPATRTKKTILF